MNRIRSLFRQLTLTDVEFDTPLDRRQAQGIQAFSLFLTTAAIFAFVGQITLGTLNIILGPILPLLAIVFSVVIFTAISRGSIGIARYALIIEMMVVASVVILFTSLPQRNIVAILPIVLAGMLLNSGGIILVGVSIILIMLLGVIRGLNLNLIT
ncbi:MAG: hypothetical protein AAF125_24320, partial [Chloroflexota bacterium]